MKKIIVMLSLGVLVAGSSFAQTAPQKDKKARTEQRGPGKGQDGKEKRTPEERAQLRTERMSERLELNASQKQKVQALHLKQAKEMQAMRADAKSKEDAGKNREAMKARHVQYDAELKGILTPQQYAKYQADQAEMRARFEKRSQEKGQRFKGGESRQQRS
ncbi:DUF4890 domain-containing protein [Pontibacter sp. SGAir0037]|uniref:DUF4890 domain-containing protein n=1 Tax=Pontibacter sp. SGAir0037 TaxID=2571030 RepID=UPI0010CD2A22|nr:DUF4890 domain-containing protein [Pontibacter sp. SGAir0037]QCR24358.1 hypothetical protein C1N53_19660 [Pontibacter sp. SGAir0037]